jgi:inorganic triphosphatase YgiF
LPVKIRFLLWKLLSVPHDKNMETDLKLLIDSADAENFLGLHLLKKYAIEEPCVQEITSTYFDTSDLDIWRRDATLRVRRIDGNWVQTFKGGGNAKAGLHRRHEWESRISGPRPELGSLRAMVGPDTVWKKILDSSCLAHRLVPIFTTRVKRIIWPLRLAQGDQVELALDQGMVEHEDTQRAINEVELELKSGNPDHLFDFAMELQNSVPMRIGKLSKAERGYALCVPQLPPIVKASRLQLPRGLSVEQGFQAIMDNCITQVHGNEIGVAQGNSPESVHQMRVGLRRLRSALGLFKDAVRVPAAMQEELEWLAAQLGAARDWDVFSGSTLAAMAQAAPNDAALAALQQAAVNLADEKRKEAAAVINSVRYTRLVLGVHSWLRGARWRASLAAPESAQLAAPLAKFARKILIRHHGKLLKRGKRLDGADPAARHRVRIAAKKVRYATEFFQSLFPPTPARRYADRLATLQDELGWLNDIATADGLLQQLEQAHPDLAGSAGFVRGYLTSRAEREQRRLRRRWNKFARLEPPCGK